MPTHGYANSACLKTLKEAVARCLLAANQAVLGDESYFSTSIGDERAIHALGKDVIFDVTKDKAYFRSWSMHVRIEVQGVA